MWLNNGASGIFIPHPKYARKRKMTQPPKPRKKRNKRGFISLVNIDGEIYNRKTGARYSDNYFWRSLGVNKKGATGCC